MVIRVVSYNIIGSFKNPLWHLDAVSELYTHSKQFGPFIQKTLVPYESLDTQLISQIQNLDSQSKNNLQFQLGLDQLHHLREIQEWNISTQVWIDQKINSAQLGLLETHKEKIELVFVPTGHFECKKEIEKICALTIFPCRLLLIPKTSIHSPHPNPETYYHWLEIFKNKNLSIENLILKKHFQSLNVELQNLFLNPHPQNLIRYAKGSSYLQGLLYQTGKGLNFLSFNYFSYLFLTIIRPSHPVLFPALSGHLIRVYHRIIAISLFLSWPARKVYWFVKYQFEKRALGHHDNEV